MLGLIIVLIVVGACGYAIFNKYKAQTVLLAGGFVMMAFAIILGTAGAIVPAKTSTGNIWFDMFQFVANLVSQRAAELGMMIMVVSGFATYMDKIGASRVLVHICIRPLKLLKSPYLVMALLFIIGQFMHLFISSASGLGVLLMVTMYPILIKLGVSRNGATAVIGTTSAIDFGPSSGNTVLAAKTAGMQVVDYFVKYQLPATIFITICIAITHYFVQRWFDKKEGHVVTDGVADEQVNENSERAETLPPLWYAILPVLPIALILGFGYFKFKGINLDVIPSMFVSLFVAMTCEFIVTRDLKKVFAGIQAFFDTMGSQFANVVTLIVAGETLAKGLTSLGAIDLMINATQAAGFGQTAMVFVMSGIIAVSCIVMGSGNAPFFAFSAFAPQVAKKLGIESVHLLFPMQLTSSMARAISPITAVIVAVCGISGASPFEVVKRTAIPMTVGLILVQIVTYVMFKG